MLSSAPHVSNKNAILDGYFLPLPKHYLFSVASQEITVTFIPSLVMHFFAENMPVIQRDEAPAVTSLHRAGAVSPRNAYHPFDKVRFSHGLSDFETGPIGWVIQQGHVSVKRIGHR